MKVGNVMPLVRVDMIKGKSPEYKKAVFDCIHAGLIESIGIEDWDRGCISKGQ